ncbi:ABC transporter permease [Paenibacillus sp. NEAU-GSW1]|uniref:ABC transporter permease n=1 Tax=Paenibacillus sp. NEAU-GSW1 TaxID=2682486 RepID=UPI0012E113D2|nr:ABC transporter permease [Paenibacillus sp. NEAU-GSW1]MUT65155.1 ABC transporter permease [Paenibacillus sp. NEAU-GSW1]
MRQLIKNEFFKLKREWFLLFLFLLSILPVLSGGAAAFMNNSTKSVRDLFFFMNNQFALFFPMVMFILVGSIFYQEYKNKTYINWITYGYSKTKLFFAKAAVSCIVGLLFAAVLFSCFSLLLFILQGMGQTTVSLTGLFSLAFGFALEAAIIIFVTTCAGAIVINLGRNIIVTTVIGVIYGFVSCFFIGTESGYMVPGGFAYRAAMYFSDKSTYYEAPVKATIGGSASVFLSLAVLLAIGLVLFSRKRKIEN